MKTYHLLPSAILSLLLTNLYSHIWIEEEKRRITAGAGVLIHTSATDLLKVAPSNSRIYIYTQVDM